MSSSDLIACDPSLLDWSPITEGVSSDFRKLIYFYDLPFGAYRIDVLSIGKPIERDIFSVCNSAGVDFEVVSPYRTDEPRNKTLMELFRNHRYFEITGFGPEDFMGDKTLNVRFAVLNTEDPIL